MACLDDIENVVVGFEYKTVKTSNSSYLIQLLGGEDEYIAVMTVIKSLM